MKYPPVKWYKYYLENNSCCIGTPVLPNKGEIFFGDAINHHIRLSNRKNIFSGYQIHGMKNRLIFSEDAEIDICSAVCLDGLANGACIL